jgi:hypothetical protein
MLISEFLKCMLAIIQKHLSAVIIASAIIIASIIFAYFNPYQSCKRDVKNQFKDSKGQVLSYLFFENCGK